MSFNDGNTFTFVADAVNVDGNFNWPWGVLGITVPSSNKIGILSQTALYFWKKKDPFPLHSVG